MLKKGIAVVLGSCCLNVGLAQQTTQATELWKDVERDQTTLQNKQREKTLKSGQPADKDTPSSQSSTPPSTSQVTPKNEACLPLESVSIKGLQLLPRGKRSNIYKHLPHGCIKASQLDGLVKRISDTFLDAGFFNISLKQTKKDKALTWEVQVAEIDEIRNKTTLRAANLFPKAIGKPLNIKDLDQGLDQANRLGGRKVSVDVFPKDNNKVALALVEEKSKSVYGNLSVDNLGGKSTGRKQFRAGIHADNPLGLADKFSLYTASTLDGSREYSRGATAFYSIPYGYWTLSSYAGVYRYKTQTRLTNNVVLQTGKTQRFGLKAERVISRNQHHISSAFAEVSHSKINSYFQDSLVDVQSPEITAFSLGIDHTQLFDNAVLNLNARYRQGNADINNVGKERFNSIALSVNAEQQRKLFGKAFAFRHELEAQHGNHRLPGAETLSITGNAAVVGFRDSGVSGDRGFYLREHISTLLPIKSYYLQPYVVLTAGRVWSKERQYESAVGGALGIKAYLDQWQIDFSIAKGKHFIQGGEDKSLPTQLQLQLHWFF